MLPLRAYAYPPWVSEDRRVMTLITPFTAFAPHSAAPGPLITSMRSTSSSITSCASQNTPEKSGVYTTRPSISTKSLLSMVLLKPRALIAYELALERATSRLGASRRASERRVAPERRMSSPVITKIAAGASASRSACRDTEVIWMLPSSSMLRSARSATRMGCAPTAAEARKKTLKTSARRQRTLASIEQVLEIPVRTIPQAPYRCFDDSSLNRRLDGVQRANPIHHVGET